jgi:AcrR family transcriptional regulator
VADVPRDDEVVGSACDAARGRIPRRHGDRPLSPAGCAFSLLYVRTAAPHEHPAADLTARARIRDAAVECFAAEGFDAPFRVVAARAGVSPALITHHFGSKSALRDACDTEVLRRYREMKAEGIAEPSARMLATLTAPGMSATLIVYVLRAILAGGTSAREFIDHLIDDARQVMADSVAAGLVRPSRDEEARLRYLTYESVGALIVQFVTMPDVTPEEFASSLHAKAQDTILPTLELYTEGLLTDRQLLDDYLAYRDAPPAESTTSTATPRRSAARTAGGRTRPAAPRSRP